jgi:hypothetical protein
VDGLGEGITNIGANSASELGDRLGGSYVQVAKNYTANPGGSGTGGDGSDGMRLADTNVGVSNYGITDYIYFDAQLNDGTKQLFDSTVVGIVDGSGFRWNFWAKRDGHGHRVRPQLSIRRRPDYAGTRVQHRRQAIQHH